MIIPDVSTPLFCSSEESVDPALSSPAIPQISAPPPKEATLLATLVAPPGIKLSELTRTTGTGASGEILSTLPQINSSKIKSPSTKTLALGNL